MSPEKLQQLSVSECWTLLRTTTVARLAVVTATGPDIFPINFVVDHGTVVFRTAEGTKLLAALGSDRVAVEADSLQPTTSDADAGTAWSVVIKGRAVEITRLHDLVGTLDLPLFPWHDSAKNHFVRIVPDEVTGRRFHIVPPTHWTHPLSGAPHASPE
jgi:nitroimidazol reductase NimA-like FMN-containing flavoprotein (pyridoxamine 5'-phosphate oxidase superfamily)